jgi:hypothetical protein
VAAVAPNDPFEDRGFEGMTMQEIEDAIVDDATWASQQIIALLRANAKMAADIDVLNRLLGL